MLNGFVSCRTVLCLLADPGEASLQVFVELHLLPKHIGLEPGNVAGFPLPQQTEERTVNRRMPNRHIPQISESGCHGLAQRRCFRVTEPVVLSEIVGHRPQEGDVERNRLMIREDGQRGGGPRRVPHAQLVEHVRVGGGEIGDRIVAQQQSLEHRLVDDATGPLFVGADGLHTGSLDRRPQRLIVNPIEINLGTACRIRLRPERHQDEAEWPQGMNTFITVPTIVFRIDFLSLSTRIAASASAVSPSTTASITLTCQLHISLLVWILDPECELQS